MEHDLAALLDNTKKPFSEPEIKCLLLQLLQAIAFLHENWIIHRDIKLSNLLFNNKGQLKLADFGLARYFGYPLQNYTPKVVTLWYRAPELLLGVENYTTAIDMWSVGCIMGEFILNTPLLPGTTEIEQLQLICKLIGHPNENIWPGFNQLPGVKNIQIIHQPYNNIMERFPNNKNKESFFELLNGLLTYNPERRLTAAESLVHSYFTEKPFPQEIDLMSTFPTSFHTQKKKTTQQEEKDNKEEYRTAKRKREGIDNLIYKEYKQKLDLDFSKF